MVDIHHRGVCAAPLPFTFAFLDDYRNVTSWMFGLSKFEPVGASTHGLGAVYDTAFAVRPVKLSSTLEVTEWEQDAVIAFHSTKGFTNWSTWRLSADGDERTEVDVVFSYSLPGGLAGRALGKALEPIVALSVRHSDNAFRRRVEAAYQVRG